MRAPVFVDKECRSAGSNRRSEPPPTSVASVPEATCTVPSTMNTQAFSCTWCSPSSWPGWRTTRTARAPSSWCTTTGLLAPCGASISSRFHFCTPGTVFDPDMTERCPVCFTLAERAGRAGSPLPATLPDLRRPSIMKRTARLHTSSTVTATPDRPGSANENSRKLRQQPPHARLLPARRSPASPATARRVVDARRQGRPALPLSCVTYIIAEPCIDIKDRSCMDVCPVDCIHEAGRILVIDAAECIDCGACEPECPVEAIFAEDALPDKWQPFVRINYAYPEGMDVINTLVDEYATEHNVLNPPLETS